MGIGKYFHRDKSDSPKESKARSRATSFGAIDPSLQTARYESMPPAALPQTGTYPIKGNNSTAAVAGQKSPFRHSTDNRPNQTTRPETAPSHHATTTRTTTTTTTTAPRIPTPKTNNNFSDYHFFDQDQPNLPTNRGPSPNTRQMQRDSGLEQDFSALNVGDNHAVGSATPPPISFYGGQSLASNRIDPRVDSVPRSDPRLRNVDQTTQQPNSPSYGRGTPSQQQYSPSYDNQAFNRNNYQTSTEPKQRIRDSFSDVDEAKAARRASIPRKQVGTAGNAPISSTTSSPVSSNYPSQSPTQPPPPVPKHGDYPEQQSAYQDSRSLPQQRTPVQSQQSQNPQTQLQYDERMRQGEYRHPSAVPQGLKYNHGQGPLNTQSNSSQSRAPPLFPRAQNTSDTSGAEPAAQEIIQRAHQNTKDTEVIERIAPAVVQEKVVEKVHHKREEVITREIHTHDVYHRILPIIDVEVLPPRHFLPVEGGGLVEIGADEVPGRAKNWVIAETASKIPSDQPAPKGPRRFTARQFPGREGDTVEYVTPEGIKRSEETWVHPPELETGGRDTGQTWPMVFKDDSGGKDAKIRTHGHSSSKDGKRVRNRRSNGAAQAQGQGQYGSSY